MNTKNMVEYIYKQSELLELLGIQGKLEFIHHTIKMNGQEDEVIIRLIESEVRKR